MGILITISREFGSGGRELGRRLADLLGIAYYDKEILLEIEHKTPFSKEYIAEVCESRPIPLFPIHYGNSWAPVSDPHLKQSIEVYRAQADIMKELASKSSCIIIGRCADYVLRGEKPLRIFVYSDMESKIARCRKREKEHENISDKEIAKRIRAIDKRRKKYYEFYTGQSWGDRSNYDMLLNTANVSIPDLAEALARQLMKKESK